ncbi:MAG: fused MFS/spermidine synthase [Pseudomonadota bacterium]
MNGTRWALYALLFLSGSAGLAYQSIWTKLFTVSLGHEMPSLLAVVAAFFGGVSLGAWLLSKTIAQSRYPGRWYAGCELAIGAWALVTLALQPVFNSLALSLIGVEPHPLYQWTVAFGLLFLILLPATFAMGATLPAMEQVIARRSSDTRVVGGAYAANTLGAVAGVLASVFWLLPTLGLRFALLLFAAVNVLCAVGIVLFKERPPIDSEPVAKERSTAANQWLVMLFATGLLGIGYEVLAVRVLSQVFEGTLFSFATALAVYLAFSSAGAAFIQRRIEQAMARNWLPRLILGLGFSCWLGLLTMYAAVAVYRRLRLAFGDTMLDVFLSEMMLALSVYGLPSLFMGALFALLAQHYREERGEVGRALSINTLGAALAPIVFGIVLLPLLGAKWSLGVVCVGYFALLPLASDPQDLRGRWVIPATLILPVVALLLIPPLQIVTLRKGEMLVTFNEGVMATTAVVEQGGARNLRVNNRYQMGGTTTAALLFQQRQAHLPILFHGDPQNALILAVASGATVGAAAAHTDLQVDAVELVPEVLNQLDYFSPHNGTPQRKDNVRFIAADARRFVRTAADQYDVIVADLYHPARDGAGMLFTEEHYTAIRSRLSADGLFCHWLPFHQLDMDGVELITRTFLAVFPDAKMIIASDNLNYPALGLVTGLDESLLREGYLRERVTDTKTRQALQASLIRNDLQLFSSVVLDTDALIDLAGRGPLNTDNRPILSYAGPQFTYNRKSQPYGRMMALIDRYEEPSTRLFSDEVSNRSAFLPRFHRYLKARNQYLRGLQRHVEIGQEAAIPLYLDAARLSPDHETVIAQLFGLATRLANTSPNEARALVDELVQIRPDLEPLRSLQEQLQNRTRRRP